MNRNNKLTLILFVFAAILWAWWVVSETPQNSSNGDVAQLKNNDLGSERRQNTSGEEDLQTDQTSKQSEVTPRYEESPTTVDEVAQKNPEDSNLEVPSDVNSEGSINNENANQTAGLEKPKGNFQSGADGTKLKTRVESFPGIKQGVNDVMLSGLQYIPGENEDSFVATFQLARSGDGFDGNAWIIADYVQRGTKSLMSMPSHSSLNLTAEGAPKNPRVGVRLTMDNRPSKSLSKRFTVPRPGFEGEELSLVRVGIFDRKNGKLHVASVSGAQLGRKKAPRRARINGP
jgi:hypothetical protein